MSLDLLTLFLLSEGMVGEIPHMMHFICTTILTSWQSDKGLAAWEHIQYI